MEELHLSFNQIEISDKEKINEKDQVFPKISILHFDGNRVENRDHLQWLSTKFPSLTSLVLCDCPLWTLRWTSPAARETQVGLSFLNSIDIQSVIMYKVLAFIVCYCYSRERKCPRVL